jgi:hypothetical protein
MFLSNQINVFLSTVKGPSMERTATLSKAERECPVSVRAGIAWKSWKKNGAVSSGDHHWLDSFSIYLLSMIIQTPHAYSG